MARPVFFPGGRLFPATPSEGRGGGRLVMKEKRRRRSNVRKAHLRFPWQGEGIFSNEIAQPAP